MARPVNVRRAHLARPVALAVVLLAGCSLSRRDVPTGDDTVREYLHVASRAPGVMQTVDTAPQQVWRARIGRGTLGAVAMGERVAAIATVDRFVHLVDQRTGRVLWRFRGNAPYATGPLIAHGRVFAATGSIEGRLFAIGLESGKQRWSREVGDVSAPLVLRDTVIYGATQRGVVFAVKTGNGDSMWRRSLSPIASAPVVAGGRVAVVTLTDSLMLLDAASGRPVVRAALPTGTASAPALVGDSALVIASARGDVMLVSLDSGRVVWHRRGGEPIFGAPVVSGDTAYALTNRCTLLAIPLATPAAADSTAIDCLSVAAPLLVRGGVVVATVGGELVYYDRAARRRVWTRSAGGELQHPPGLRNGQIIVAPTVGDVVSYR